MQKLIQKAETSADVEPQQMTTQEEQEKHKEGSKGRAGHDERGVY